jgi:ABC-type polar amino acid transport system ATPase subunit
MPDTQPAILLDRVARHYTLGDSIIRAVDDVSLSVAPGEFLALLGSSGSGKSTLLNLIAGLDRPTSGAVIAHGQDLSKVSSLELARYRRQTVGMVFQSFNLLPRMTLEENVELPLRLAEVERSDRAARVHEALDRVGLGKRITHRPSELSGGEQQRAAIARALAVHPEVILFDEPTSALDPELVGEVLATIQALAAEGRTMIIVTHEMAFARDVSSRTVFLCEGRIEEEGASMDLFRSPKSPRLQKFLEPFVSGRFSGESRKATVPL